MSKIILGLTGGIASGKSEVANIFLQLGTGVVDADILSRKVVEKGTSGAAKLAKEFPDAFCDGVLDRSRLRNIVFGDSIKLKKLNAIMHPLIKNLAQTEIEKCDKSIVVFVVPLLYESGYQNMVTKTLTISIDNDLRIQRLIKRDNISIDLASSIISSQLSDAEREKLSDYVIVNNGNKDDLKREVEKIFMLLKG